MCETPGHTQRRHNEQDSGSAAAAVARLYSYTYVRTHTNSSFVPVQCHRQYHIVTGHRDDQDVDHRAGKTNNIIQLRQHSTWQALWWTSHHFLLTLPCFMPHQITTTSPKINHWFTGNRRRQLCLVIAKRNSSVCTYTCIFLLHCALLLAEQ